MHAGCSHVAVLLLDPWAKVNERKPGCACQKLFLISATSLASDEDIQEWLEVEFEVDSDWSSWKSAFPTFTFVVKENLY